MEPSIERTPEQEENFRRFREIMDYMRELVLRPDNMMSQQEAQDLLIRLNEFINHLSDKPDLKFPSGAFNLLHFSKEHMEKLLRNIRNGNQNAGKKRLNNSRRRKHKNKKHKSFRKRR